MIAAVLISALASFQGPGDSPPSTSGEGGASPVTPPQATPPGELERLRARERELLERISVLEGELRAEKARRNKEAALAAFIGKKAEIDEMLSRLQALSDDHFNCHPDEAGWAMVGTLEHYASLLKRITDMAFNEGEHAE